jgi:hypothetical protein
MSPGIPARTAWVHGESWIEFRSGVAENFQHSENGDIIAATLTVLNDATV